MCFVGGDSYVTRYFIIDSVGYSDVRISEYLWEYIGSDTSVELTTTCVRVGDRGYTNLS